MRKKLTKKEIIEKFISVHGDKYDYSKVEYMNFNTKVCIICPEHGEFWQLPGNHLKGQDCPKCGNKKIIDKIEENRRKNAESFIQNAEKIHKKKYDYSKSEYINNREKISIICPIHGKFEQTPDAHLHGQGCPKCGIEKNINGRRKTKEWFIEKARKVHGDRYDYSKVEYINNHTKVCIICPEHGEFWQRPMDHFNGLACSICGGSNRKTNEDFIINACEIHKDKYDYSKTVYVNAKTPVLIICPEHGEFQQTPDIHLRGSGCPHCKPKYSKDEKEICEFLKEHGITVNENIRDKDFKEIDILCSDFNIGIEYDGITWHSEKYNGDKNYHIHKTELCKQHGIKLLHIFEDEWFEHKDIVLEKLKHVFHINDGKIKIGARKTCIKGISKFEAKKFLNQYHLQGFVTSTIYYGAFLNDGTLIGVMSFKKDGLKTNAWELTRFATDYHYITPGLGSKIFKAFVNEYNPLEVKSFADRRWTLNENNNLYTKIGFTLDKILPPDYRYVVGRKRVHKFNFRKQTLHRKYGFSLTMTEKQMCHELGLYRIWDCGLYKYVWKNGNTR